MARSLWEVFHSLLDRSGGGSEDAEEDDSGFLPSPIDLSIRDSHGGSDVEIDRELNKINERARELVEKRHED
ncbi:hypothetical protein U4E84_05645 [Halorubrum sp. AD140]|uniref:hypothetical protein n=1 Tax=Halorubrum sp. AD140 TaxID=3050073 RepID=UPI002ACC412A|nr:hypothetical protein [Halorubrum sp. AD140]MDZ5810826.1 hypothetical protein [Halorubrum sp. AD140]